MNSIARVSVLVTLAGCFAVGCGPGIPGDLIATTEPFSRGLDQSADRLFWHGEEGIFSLPKGGGEPEQLASGQRPMSLRVAGSDVCWMNREGEWQVRCAPQAGGEVRTLAAQAEDEFTVRPMATDGTNLYWSTSARKIRRVALAGGDAVDFSAVDAESASVAVTPEGEVFASDQRGIVRLPGGGAEPVRIAGGAVVVPSGIALSNPPDDFVYWTEIGISARDGLVLRAPKAGGEVVLLARRQTLPSELVVDGQHVWWATGGGTDRIRRIGTNGGREEDFANGGNQVGTPVVDAENVFWIDPDGNVHRAAK